MGKKVTTMKKIAFFGGILFLSFFLSSCDTDAIYNRGLSYYEGDFYSKAIRCYKIAALFGHPYAQTNLGYCYSQGVGVEQNDIKAANYFRMAAEKGVATSQYNLGVCFENGEGVPQDDNKAFQWYLKAAKQGYPDAQSAIGTRYYHGRGVEQNYKKAVEWYTKAANANCADALFLLGRCYDYGNGVKKDHQKAQILYDKAYAAGYDAPYSKTEYWGWDTFEDDDEEWQPDTDFQADIETAIRLLLGEWNDMHNKKDMTIAFRVYNKSTQYYHQEKSVEEIIKSKEKLLSKYPDFKQELSDIKIGLIDLDNIDKKPVRINFTKTVTTSSNTPSKEYPSYLDVMFIDYDWKILTESDYVTDKNLAKRKENANK